MAGDPDEDPEVPEGPEEEPVDDPVAPVPDRLAGRPGRPVALPWDVVTAAELARVQGLRAVVASEVMETMTSEVIDTFADDAA